MYDVYILIFIISYRVINKMVVQTLQIQKLWRLKRWVCNICEIIFTREKEILVKNCPLVHESSKISQPDFRNERPLNSLNHGKD